MSALPHGEPTRSISSWRSSPDPLTDSRKPGRMSRCRRAGIEAVKQIRIILAEMPAMLRDIITEIVASEPDLTIVDMLPDQADLEAAVRRTQADIVVLQQASGAEEDGRTARRLTEHRFKVLAISDDGRRGLLYELRPHRTSLGELSATDLVTSIRAAVGAGSS